MRPSQRDWLKGVKLDKGHGEFILVQPLAVKVKAYDLVLPSSRVVVSCSRTAAGSSLYIHRLTPDRFIESQGRLIQVFGSVSTTLTYNTSYTTMAVYHYGP